MAKAAAAPAIEHIARRPFGYSGKDLDWGQIFKLVGAPNDAKLIRLGYVMLYDAREHDRVTCPDCGAEFTGHNAKIEHVRMRHRELAAGEEDELYDRLEKKLETVSPIYWDQTIASQGR